MDHEADVRLVDPHPEGVGRDDHVDLAAKKLFLGFGALRHVEPGVVGDRATPGTLDHLCLLLGGLAGAGVDNAAARSLLNFRQQALDALPLRGGIVCQEADVRTVESGQDTLWILQVQVLREIFTAASP